MGLDCELGEGLGRSDKRGLLRMRAVLASCFVEVLIAAAAVWRVNDNDACGLRINVMSIRDAFTLCFVMLSDLFNLVLRSLDYQLH